MTDKGGTTMNTATDIILNRVAREERVIARLDAEGLLDKMTARQVLYVLECCAEDLALHSARRMASMTTVAVSA
jgi:beta-lactamase class A